MQAGADFSHALTVVAHVRAASLDARQLGISLNGLASNPTEGDSSLTVDRFPFGTRHNLKRKVACLAPISKEEFERRVQAYVGEQGNERGKKKEHLGNKAREKAEKREKKMQEKRAAQMQAESSHAAGAREVPEISSEIEEDGPVDVRDMSEEEFMEWKLQVRVLLGRPRPSSSSSSSSSPSHLPQGRSCPAATKDGLVAVSMPHSALGSWPLLAGTDALDGTQLEGLCDETCIFRHICSPAHAATSDPFAFSSLQNSVQLAPGDSLFDRHSCDDTATNLEYMATTYGFFVPYIEHVEDLPALMDYLGQKVSVGNVCLWCNKSFNSMEGVQKHMIDKSHCKVQLEGNEDEFQDFYDISLHGEEDEWETDSEEEVDQEIAEV